MPRGKPTHRKPKEPAPTWDDVRALVGSLPSVQESTSYGTPALKVVGNLFVRQHQDGVHLVVPMPRAERSEKLRLRPDLYHLTDHYVNYDYVLVALAAACRDELATILYAAWRVAAPAKVLAAYDAGVVERP